MTQNSTNRLSIVGIALLALLLIFFKSLIAAQILPSSAFITSVEFIFTIGFLILGFIQGRRILKYQEKEQHRTAYLQRLNNTLIAQSRNELFYTGNIELASMAIVRDIADSLDTDRASIWSFNSDGSAILCKQLYLKESREFIQGLEIRQEHFQEYFDALHDDPIIIANDAFIHPATKCFSKDYLKPNGIKSMLDVPIWFRGSLYGVICIESKQAREWKKEEVDFAQLLSSLYSFARAVKENNTMLRDSEEMDKFVDSANIVTKADANGKITYVNKKFEEVSGWKLREVLGKDHSIVNSGVHPKSFWKAMYKRIVIDRRIWHGIITNRTKNGELYYVDSYIKANFDDDGNLTGFMSIRNDLTELVESSLEIEKKNTYLEHAAKILRHDMHSGINTYLPRGITSLERRLTPETITDLKLEAPLKMLKEGLKHAQKVYRGVFEFTDLVKKDAKLNTKECNIKDTLKDFLSSTAYSSQVILDDSLPIAHINESLFCTALDNLIRNGLKYNDSETKWVKVYADADNIYVEDNGRGMSQDDFDHLSRPYTRKEGQKESGTGLGLNICKAILQEHKFEITCKKLEQGGTQLKIKIK